MPIPDFDHNNVLPPHTGDPTAPLDLSPYPCSVLELCQRFATSKERVKILSNLIGFRDKMTKLGIITGFQWLGGSFLQDIEREDGRPPRDLDVVTFFGGLTVTEQQDAIKAFPELVHLNLAKSNFLLDHYLVDYCYDSNVTVEQTRYWIQLFTHTRSGVWKGMLRVTLNSPNEDKIALDYLNSINP